MAAIANLAISLTARTSKFTKGMTRARKVLARFGSGLTAVARKGALLGTALAAAAAAGIVLLVRNAFQAIDVLAKTSDKLGLTIESLVGLRKAARLSGVEIRTFDMGIQRMTRRIAEAGKGTGEAKAALKELGLDARKLAKMPVNKQFLAIADAMEKVTSQGDRVRLGFKLFDSEGVALINTLRGGSANLTAITKRMSKFGLVVSRKGAAAVEKANDALSDMKDLFTGVGRTIAVRLAPAVTMIATKFVDWAIAGEGLGVKVSTNVERIVNAVVGFAAQLKSIDVTVIKGIKTWIKWTVIVGAAILIVPKVIAVLGTLVAAFKAVTGAQTLMLALAGPVGWATIATGMGVAVIAAKLLGNQFDNLTSDIQRSVREAEKIGKTLGGTSGSLVPAGIGQNVRLGALNPSLSPAALDRAIVSEAGGNQELLAALREIADNTRKTAVAMPGVGGLN